MRKFMLIEEIANPNLEIRKVSLVIIIKQLNFFKKTSMHILTLV